VSDLKQGSSPAAATANAESNVFNLRLVDVTGSRRVTVPNVHVRTPVSRVLEAAARGLGIPRNQPVSLRRDDTSVVAPDAMIGEAIDTDTEEEFTVVPNAHLGGEVDPSLEVTR
jgi:hypothetical protein